jgi:3-methyladenine DNA glycosylase AlkC
MHRIRRAGEILFEALAGRRDGAEIYERLATHTSDTVRGWAAHIITADASMPLDRRLGMTRRFAADSNMAVREFAWMSFRPYVARDLPEALSLLQEWVTDPDPNIRRCAVEGTRPRGVWTNHIPDLKENPEPAEPLLEAVNADPSRYVQNAVANWLNDASKTRPDWVTDLCVRWKAESPVKETQYIVKRALRTLKK